MTDTALQSQIAAARAYEGFFVPALFREWAPRVIDAAQLQRGDRVLDVACGTGVLAREAAARLGSGRSVAGVDPNLGMLTVAARAAPDIEWREGIAESLPYPDGSHDVIVSQFGLMFFLDRHKALREMLRVLKPGGRLAVAVWGRLEDAPAFAAEVELLERVAGERAAEAMRAPFALGDPDELRALFRSAGVASIAVAMHRGTARFPSIRAMLEADLRGWLPLVGVVLTEDQIRRVLEAGEMEFGCYLSAEGTLAFEVHALIVTGVRE